MKRDFRGVEKNAEVLGKVRLIDADGVEITEQVGHGVKATIGRWLSDVVGKFTPVNSEGEPLTLDTINQKLDEIKALTSRQNIVSCPATPVEIPGILAGDAFDAGDCFGTLFQIRVPKSGVIASATFWDMDDEGSQIDLMIFKLNIAQIASDAAWAPSDVTMLKYVTMISFVTFKDHGGMRISEVFNVGKGYNAPDGILFIQAVCVGTPNIAANNMPLVQIQIDSDDPTWTER